MNDPDPIGDAIDNAFENPAGRKMLAQLLGWACMLELWGDTTWVGREPAWVANIEAAAEGCSRRAKRGVGGAYEDYLEMTLHWFAPAAEAYMENRDERDPDISARLIAVLSRHWDVIGHDIPNAAFRAARHAAKRILGGAA